MSDQTPDNETPDNETPDNNGPRPLDAEAHRKKMQELFGDLDDEDNEADVTLDSLRVAREQLHAQITDLKLKLAETRLQNLEYKNKADNVKAELDAIEAHLKAEKKNQIIIFGHEILPHAEKLAADVAGISAEERAQDAKFAKLVQGVEKTVLKLADVFNSHGIKKGQTPQAANATPNNDADQGKPGTQEISGYQPAQAPEVETIESLQTQNAALLNDVTTLTTTLMRAQQDNLALHQMAEEAKNSIKRKQAEAEKEKAYALEKIVKDLIPAIDTMELGLNEIRKNSALAHPSLPRLEQDLKDTLSSILGIFNKYGAQQLNPLGQPYDENRHEVISTSQDDSFADDTVTMVHQKGYMLKDRVLRTAKVVVKA